MFGNYGTDISSEHSLRTCTQVWRNVRKSDVVYASIKKKRDRSDCLDLLQTEFRYDFRKGPRDISAGTVLTVFTVFICILAFNYRKYRKFRTGRNLTRTFPKIVPKFVLQKGYCVWHLTSPSGANIARGPPMCSPFTVVPAKGIISQICRCFGKRSAFFRVGKAHDRFK